MPPLRNDADVERLIQRSAVFRLARAVLVAIDDAVASSIVARVVTQRLSLDALGVILLVAGATHAAIVTLVPIATAPAGRYVFAIDGGIAGALLLAARSVRLGPRAPQ